MKKVLTALALLVFITGCSGKSSPTEPNNNSSSKPASLYGFVRLCGYDLGTLTITDSTGASHVTTLDAGGNFSFGYVFNLGPYTAFINKAGLPQMSQPMSGKDQLNTGSNQFYWEQLNCPTLNLALDLTTCQTKLKGNITGTITEVSTGWKSSIITLAPGNSVITTLPKSDSYHILFEGVYLDGTSWQWSYTFPVTANLLTYPSYTFTMSCGNGTAFRGEPKNIK